MVKELVSDVRGDWYEVTNGVRLHLTCKVNGIPWSFTFGEAESGALSTWLAQPKEPTAEEIAVRLVERWDRNTDLAEASWGEKLADLERHIAAAIVAEREREGA